MRVCVRVVGCFAGGTEGRGDGFVEHVISSLDARDAVRRGFLLCTSKRAPKTTPGRIAGGGGGGAGAEVMGVQFRAGHWPGPRGCGGGGGGPVNITWTNFARDFWCRKKGAFGRLLQHFL